MTGKRVLIVILVYNGVDYIGDCLESLSKTIYPEDLFEILVIDNASPDASVSFIKNKWPEIKLIVLDKNIGFAGGNNPGFQYGIDHGFDYVYLLNQDTVVDPNFLQEAVTLAEDRDDIGAVQSKLLLHHTPDIINTIGNEIHYLGFAFAGGYKLADFEMRPREITYPSGCCTLHSVAVLKKVGLFNEDFFMYHEDTDLGWRIWLGGFRVLLSPSSVVYHKYEFLRSTSKFYFLERNRLLVMLQNYKLPTLFLIFPAAFVMASCMFFYSFFAGWWREELKVYAYFISAKNWGKILAVRKAIQKKRQISDKEIVKRFVGKVEFEDLSNPFLRYIANPVFNAYWQIIKRLIRW